MNPHHLGHRRWFWLGLRTAGCAICLLIATLPAQSQTPPATIYVRTTGRDSTGNGSAGSPFRTIPHAISVANTGDQIFVGPGTYSGPGEVPIVFPFARSLKIVSEQ